MRVTSYSLLSGVAMSVLVSTNVSAQDVNYGELEMLFGESVTTSATGKPQRASEVPASMIIITQDQIRRSGGNNIATILSRYAGIDVNQWSAGAVDAAVRGGNISYNPLMLVMVNGRQVYFDHFGFVNWTAIPVALDEIQQIEVVKGPMGAMFGVNAVTGVINIITKNPLYDQGGSVVAEAGNNGQLSINANARFKMNEKVALRVSGRYAEEDEFTDAVYANVPAPEQKFVASEVLFQLNDSSSLSVEGTYAESNYVTISHLRMPLNNYTETYSFKSVYSLDSSFGSIEAKVFGNWIDHTMDFTVDGNTNLEVSDAVYVAQIQDVVRVNAKNTARISFEYRDFSFSSAPDNSGILSYTLMAAGGMWEHLATDKLTFTGAARVDHIDINHAGSVGDFTGFTHEGFDRKLTEFSFNTSAVYKPNAVDTFKISMGRAVMLPGLINMALAVEAGPVNFVGNPGIKQTPSFEGEIGWNRDIEAIGGKFTSAFFYRHITDYSLFSFEANILPPQLPLPSLTPQNVGDFDSYGAEFSFSGNSGEFLSWDLNYTLNFVDEDIARNEGGDGLTVPVPFGADRITPKHKLNAHIGYEKGPWTVDVFGRLRSKASVLLIPNAQGVFPYQDFDAALKLDARIAYRFSNGVEIFATGDNITGADRAGISAFRTEARFRGGLRLSF